MKKIFIPLFILFISLYSSLSLAQIEVEKTNDEASTQGFFVNGGQQKIEALECYTFKDLIVSFNLRDEFFAYDQIAILLEVGVPEAPNPSLFALKQAPPNQYFFYIDKTQFYRLYHGKKYAYFKILSSSDMAEKSVWKTASGRALSRSVLQHTDKKANVDKAVLKATFCAGTSKGTKIVYETLSDGRTVAKNVPQMDWAYPVEFSINLKNRILISLLKDYPKLPVGSGDCYNTPVSSNSKPQTQTTSEEETPVVAPKPKPIQSNNNSTNVGYFENGTKKFEGDKLNGAYKEWNSNGELKTEETYSNGKKNGPAKYYASGTVQRTGNFIDDKEDGLWVYFHSNNIKSEEGSFVVGKKNGVWKQWDRNGKLMEEGAFENGKRNGTLKRYDADGKIRTEIPYVDGVKNGLGYKIDSKGQRVEENWKDGSLQQ